jgi:hypothetical protein
MGLFRTRILQDTQKRHIRFIKLIEVFFMFLDDLELSDEERQKLRRLGAKSALMLLLMRKSSPNEFDAYVGSERAQHIEGGLMAMLTEEDRGKLAAEPVRPGALGSRLGVGGRPVSLVPPSFEINERDRLFGELQDLRMGPSKSIDRDGRIAELERKLNQLLDERYEL